jgi:hypothetical protein
MIYMTEQPVLTLELQDVIRDHFQNKSPKSPDDNMYPTKPEGDVTTFYVPSHPKEAFLLLYRQYLYTTNQAMERGIGKPATSRETVYDWHAYVLSCWLGFVLINGSALLVAYPLLGGVKPSYRIFLTRSSTSVSLASIKGGSAYYRRFENKFGWTEVANLQGLPAYVRPPECLNPQAVKQMWDNGKLSVQTGP